MILVIKCAGFESQNNLVCAPEFGGNVFVSVFVQSLYLYVWNVERSENHRERRIVARTARIVVTLKCDVSPVICISTNGEAKDNTRKTESKIVVTLISRSISRSPVSTRDIQSESNAS